MSLPIYCRWYLNNQGKLEILKGSRQTHDILIFLKKNVISNKFSLAILTWFIMKILEWFIKEIEIWAPKY